MVHGLVLREPCAGKTNIEGTMLIGNGSRFPAVQQALGLT
jgi:hypothetical protein